MTPDTEEVRVKPAGHRLEVRGKHRLSTLWEEVSALVKHRTLEKTLHV